MGQFDSQSAAALARLKSESLSSSADAVATTAVGIGSKILDLAGFAGFSKLTDLVLTLKNLAAKKDEGNLIYFGEALVDDISRLYKLNDQMRRQIDELLNTKEFDQAIANATLHITRTNVEARLRRIATLIANGVRMHDLEAESLDDMMRTAVELKDEDVILLGNLYKWQNHILTEKGMNPTKWFGDIQQAHNQLIDSGFLNQRDHLKYRSSYLRLESLGLIQEISAINNHGGVGYELYALLLEGKKFYERVQEIGLKE